MPIVGAAAYMAWIGVRSVVPSEPSMCNALNVTSRSTFAIVYFTAAMSVRVSCVDELSIFHAVSSTNSRSIRICAYESAIFSCTIWCSAMIFPCDSRLSARSHIMSKANLHWAIVRIAWWMRPPPNRRWANTLAPFSGPSRWSSGTRTSLYLMWLWLRGSGMISTPGVVRGTTYMPFVHMTKRMSATRPALVNHFSPLMTHSSPSRVADVLKRFGSEPP